MTDIAPTERAITNNIDTRTKTIWVIPCTWLPQRGGTQPLDEKSQLGDVESLEQRHGGEGVGAARVTIVANPFVPSDVAKTQKSLDTNSRRIIGHQRKSN